MPQYVDGFVLPIPRDNLKHYQRIAKKASKIWREHGALAYYECVGDDLDAKDMTPFPKLLKTRSNEVVIFSWAVFKSRRERDRANKAIMADPRMAKMAEESHDIFHCSRMAYGGFKVIVQEQAGPEEPAAAALNAPGEQDGEI
ncbi:MAG: DUF1428 domain-containing protein [Pedobacter sp.]|nr:MAG: DUF1428 domain-containing protein [Pedobacter sp.]